MYCKKIVKLCASALNLRKWHLKVRISHRFVWVCVRGSICERMFALMTSKDHISVLDRIPDQTVYPINYVATGLEFQCMCVCQRRRSRSERGSVYSVTHWRIVSAHNSNRVSNTVASVKRRTWDLKTVTDILNINGTLKTKLNLKWELAALRGKSRERLEKSTAGERWAFCSLFKVGALFFCWA